MTGRGQRLVPGSAEDPAVEPEEEPEEEHEEEEEPHHVLNGAAPYHV